VPVLVMLGSSVNAGIRTPRCCPGTDPGWLISQCVHVFV
jgi:hypothetical protein